MSTSDSQMASGTKLVFSGIVGLGAVELSEGLGKVGDGGRGLAHLFYKLYPPSIVFECICFVALILGFVLILRNWGLTAVVATDAAASKAADDVVASG